MTYFIKKSKFYDNSSRNLWVTVKIIRKSRKCWEILTLPLWLQRASVVLLTATLSLPRAMTPVLPQDSPPLSRGLREVWAHLGSQESDHNYFTWKELEPIQLSFISVSLPSLHSPQSLPIRLLHSFTHAAEHGAPTAPKFCCFSPILLQTPTRCLYIPIQKAKKKVRQHILTCHQTK